MSGIHQTLASAEVLEEEHMQQLDNFYREARRYAKTEAGQEQLNKEAAEAFRDKEAERLLKKAALLPRAPDSSEDSERSFGAGYRLSTQPGNAGQNKQLYTDFIVEALRARGEEIRQISKRYAPFGQDFMRKALALAHQMPKKND